jgi:hypothetical protein
MLEKSSTKSLLAVIVLLCFYNSNQVAKNTNWDQTLVNPCPNCCYTNLNRLFINRFVSQEEKILVPLFDIDQENQLLGMKEAIFFAEQLNRTLSISPTTRGTLRSHGQKNPRDGARERALMEDQKYD